MGEHMCSDISTHIISMCVLSHENPEAVIFCIVLVTMDLGLYEEALETKLHEWKTARTQ